MSVTIGTARSDLTPPLGTSLAGYFEDRQARGVHDPLLCKALYVTADNSALRLTSCDLIGIHSDTLLRAEEIAGAQTGPREQSLVCCTHTHLGPATMSLLGSPRADEYADRLPQVLAQAMRGAAGDTFAGQLSVAVTEARGVSFNRRYHMRDGSVRMNPGRGNPDVVGPAGPVDPQVLVLLARDTSGRPRALVVNFALHLDTIGGDLVSADYPHYLAQRVREALGEQVETLFANGAFGDINHIDVNDPNQPAGFAMAEHCGTRLAEAVLQACDSARPLNNPVVHAARRIVPLPARTIEPETLERARLVQVLADPNANRAEREAAAERLGTDQPDTRLRVYAREWQMLAERGPKPYEADVRVACLTPEVAFVGLPGEVFCELGLAIKRNSPFQHTFVISLANGYVGYVGTERAYSEGSYETTPARSSPLAPGAGEMLVDAALDLLRQVHSHAV